MAAPERLAFLSELFDRLFPICRSIMGRGFVESLDILREHIPLEYHRVASGTRVLDWTVPPEWQVRAARLTGPDGRIYADFATNNLSLVNYSVPVDRCLTREELAPHLHSLPELPHAIPYVTSYYKPNWGFCLSENQRKQLPAGTYHAWIDSSFVSGDLVYAQAFLPGENDQEILLSSYLCHPSLANNELSGPLTLVELYRRISTWPRRRYGYRFLLNPETIGSITYLALEGSELRRKLVAGLVLTCLGGPRPTLSYKRSKREDTLLDQLIEYIAELGEIPLLLRPFTPCGGSDERQYASPGFELPVGQVARTIYGEYAGYHNSLDDKHFMTIEALVDSANGIEHILRSFELAGKFHNVSPYGEPFLGGRNLYPNVNCDATRTMSTDSTADRRQQLDRILSILSYSNGERSMLWIARRLGCSLLDLRAPIERLEAEGLIRHAPRERT